jgi:opacity protein-like surface antigen
MRSYVLLFLALTTGLTANAEVNYQKGLYLKGEGGISVVPGKDYRRMFGTAKAIFGAAIGYEYTPFRVDMSFRYKKTPSGLITDSFTIPAANMTLTNAQATFKLTRLSAFVNVSYDLVSAEIFNTTIPYFTVGIGYTMNKLTGNFSATGTAASISSKANNIAWNIGFGFRSQFESSLELDVSYKLILNKPKFKSFKYTANTTSGSFTDATGRLLSDVLHLPSLTSPAHEVAVGVLYHF